MTQASQQKGVRGNDVPTNKGRSYGKAQFCSFCNATTQPTTEVFPQVILRGLSFFSLCYIDINIDP